jgi:hypothetical protein
MWPSAEIQDHKIYNIYYFAVQVVITLKWRKHYLYPIYFYLSSFEREPCTAIVWKQNTKENSEFRNNTDKFMIYTFHKILLLLWWTGYVVRMAKKDANTGVWWESIYTGVHLEVKQGGQR